MENTPLHPVYAWPLVLGCFFCFHYLSLFFAVREDGERQREEDTANEENVCPAPRSATGCFGSQLLPALTAVWVCAWVCGGWVGRRLGG